MVGPDARGPDWEGTPWNVDGLYQYSAFQVLGIGCNTGMVETCPTSYEEVLDPQYDGLIGAVEPGHQVLMDFWVFLEEQLGEAGMEELRDLSPVFYASAVPAQQGLAAGEIAVTTYATAQLQDDAAAGAPVEFTIPTPAWSPPILSYIVGWAKHPNAAQLVLDYMATRDGSDGDHHQRRQRPRRHRGHARRHRRPRAARRRRQHGRVGGTPAGRVAQLLRTLRRRR